MATAEMTMTVKVDQSHVRRVMRRAASPLKVLMDIRIRETELYLAKLREGRKELEAWDGGDPHMVQEPFEEGADPYRSIADALSAGPEDDGSIESQIAPGSDHIDQRLPSGDEAAIAYRCASCDAPATHEVENGHGVKAYACRNCAPQLAAGTTSISEITL